MISSDHKHDYYLFRLNTKLFLAKATKNSSSFIQVTFHCLYVTSVKVTQEQRAFNVNKSQHFRVFRSAVTLNLQTDIYTQMHTQKL
jgi:hypothetical protein